MLKTYDNHAPQVHPTVYVADQALLIGRVTLLAGVSVWPGCVLRGDVDEIIIKENSNIQDGTLVHPNHDLPAVVGCGVTVGHGVVLHGCRIGDECLIGMGAIILDGAVIGDHCIIGAGSVVTEHMNVPDRSLVLGVPGKVVRTVTDEEIAHIRKNTEEYGHLARMHAR